MCVHPRCGKPSEYLLKGTEWGDQCYLCEEHAIRYQNSQKGGEGKLIEITTGKEVDLRKEESDEETNSSGDDGLGVRNSGFGWSE